MNHILRLVVLTAVHTFASGNRCCFVGQARSGANACVTAAGTQDPFCAGGDAAGACTKGGPFSCGTASVDPDIECQNCGCCPCCEEDFVCCKPGSIDGNQIKRDSPLPTPTKLKNFIIDVTNYGESPNFNKGECRPECTNNCNGHGTCTDLPPGSCPTKSCVCDPQGFDPKKFCASCLDNNYGSDCSSCPAVVNGKACSGHGICDGAGTTSGTGKCTCTSGFDVADECASCISTSFGPDCTSCPSIVDNKVCDGHGTCDGAGTHSGTGKCTCDEKFDPTTNCENCLPLHWGTSCSICPGIVSPGTSGAVACSGHGVCDGDGSKQKGTGQCTCAYGWKGDDCSELYCPKGCKHGNCATIDNIHPTCVCDKGWSDDTCSLPKCPTPLSPGVPGCVHGNCSKTQLEHCDCEPGWGDDRCSTPICTQGCVIGKGSCVAPDDCLCTEGFSGPDCGLAVCEKPCVEGQGDCTSPNHCTCRPNFQGIQCEVNNAACCFSNSCGDAPTSCGICCQYERGRRVKGTNIVGCAGDDYTCRNCDCKECCHGGGYCSDNRTNKEVHDRLVHDYLVAGNDPPEPFSGKCCNGHREGTECQRCVTGYFGSSCKACPGSVDRSKDGLPSITCSGHGQCSEGLTGNGTCLCQAGFGGNDCSMCDNSYCPMHCSGHGECDCSASGSIPECGCENGWGGDTLEGNDDACRRCTRGFSAQSNCTDCSSGWYGGIEHRDRLECHECACDSQYCDDGNNGTGRCTNPPTPGSAPGPSGGGGNVPIVAIVSATCGLFFIGLVVYFVGQAKKRSRAREHQKHFQNATINDPLIQPKQNISAQSNDMGPPGGYGGFDVLPADQQMSKEDEAFGSGETLEERLARMAAE